MITDEKRVFSSTGSPPRADIYVYDGHDVLVYEAKKDIASAQDLYQLVLYWDGLVYDGIKPSRGVLIASGFSEGVTDVLGMLNRRQDQNGNPYVFETATWRSKQVPYRP